MISGSVYGTYWDLYSDKYYKKPRIGSKIWVLIHGDVNYAEGACTETVGYLGKESFVLEDFRNIVDEVSELRYEDYNTVWFSSKKDAVKRLKLINGDNYKPEYYILGDGKEGVHMTEIEKRIDNSRGR